jgi:crotonobetainyl-CoA:carnitine CoA-transferase CaiB-like acyl-CoA transferase
MSYTFLSDLLVIEVAQFGPDAVGGYLADLGARVIKVEPPEGGDPLRHAGPLSAGSPDGVGYMHLRWNRGKQSVAIDLATTTGADDFRKLIAQADVVVEGMRAGVLDRMGLGYEDLRKLNPRLVFCSVSGMGTTGPYTKMASHGPSFDAFAGLGTPPDDVISRYARPQPASIGMYAVSLHSALGILAAVMAARRTGTGTLLEVAAAESAAHWLPDIVDPLLSPHATHVRPGFADAQGRMRLWARMDNYRTRDNKLIYLMTLTDKSWRALLNVTGRHDLQALYERSPTSGNEDAEVAAELSRIFLTRDRAEWLADFREHNVAAMPVNSFEDLLQDPHFKARDNTYQATLPNGEQMTLMSTPIKVAGQTFLPTLAPDLGQHDAQIREEFDLNVSQ